MTQQKGEILTSYISFRMLEKPCSPEDQLSSSPLKWIGESFRESLKDFFAKAGMYPTYLC